MRTLPLLLIFVLGACRGSEPAPVEAPPAEAPPAASPAEESPLPAEPDSPAESLSPRERDQRGDQHLFEGRFDEAIADYDAYLAAEPEFEPHHWRRGLAYYYAGRYADGAAQFVIHRTVNPADVENAAWHFLCVAREQGFEAARAALLPVGTDTRPPMMTVYELFAGRATPEDVLDAAKATASHRRPNALFFGHYYVGLYHEARGEESDAREHLRLSATEHGQGHYMGRLARMHHTFLSAPR